MSQRPNRRPKIAQKICPVTTGGCYGVEVGISMENRKTHYEQVPTDDVKKIIEHVAQVKVEDGTDDWRELAQQVQSEKDPKEMIHLVQRLIDSLDESVRQKKRVRTPAE